MLLQNQTSSLTKDSLFQLIAMSPSPMGRQAVLNAFGPDDETKARAEDLLTALVAENKIISDSDRNYRAAAPWADVACAEIGSIAYDRRLSIPVKLLNVPDDLNVAVTMSRDELNRKKLKTGDRIIVGLSRNNRNPMALRARFIDRAEDNKPFYLTGTFNQSAHSFTPLDRSIKSQFKIVNEPEPSSVPRQFLVELPAHFDLRDPVINVVEDQTRDTVTGEAISRIIINKHEIAHAHPEDVLRDAQRINRRKLDTTDRVDLTHLDFVTVDPLGAPDLDDAFAVEEHADGYFLYTGIADVPALVHYNSAVDREAYARGLTYYLSDHTAHMLPDVLSTKKASLLPQEDRLAIVVKQSLGWDCRLKDFEILPAIIRSRDQFSYGQFYDLLEREDPRFKSIAAIHDTRRRKGMNAHLDAFMKDKADGYVTKSIIETLMVQSNSLMAQFLKAKGVPFISRNFEQFSSLEAQKSGMVSRAYYSSFHAGHSNLGLTDYAHATSPIRRYADIVVLRAIHTALGRPDTGLHAEEIANMDKIAAHLNDRRRVERDAAHDEKKYHGIRDLLRLQAAPIRVGIHEIGDDYIEVTVVQTGVRQRIPAAALPPNQWRLADHQLVLVNDQGQELRRYKRGDSILGQLYDVDPVQARWKVQLISPEQHARKFGPPAAKIA